MTAITTPETSDALVRLAALCERVTRLEPEVNAISEELDNIASVLDAPQRSDPRVESLLSKGSHRGS